MSLTAQRVASVSGEVDEGSAPPACFHCGLPVPAGMNLSVRIEGQERPMCCPGCAAVAQAIVDGGLSEYYRFRTEHPERGRDLVPDSLRELRLYDHPQVQRSFVRAESEGTREASLILEGIVCAACVWLNERHLRSLPGVLEAQINFTTHRARVRWDEAQIRLSDILAAIRAIGYHAHPYDPTRQQQLLERERSEQLRRIGVAGVLGMQVMMMSIALYAGDWSGMELEYQSLFRWVNLVLTLPVLLYSARPFYRSAWRDLSHLRMGMDVPVSLGISLAFAGSVWATLGGEGPVYYDSVVMFVFFLLVGRYLEFAARRRSSDALDSLARIVPATATRLRETDAGCEEDVVAVADLVPGDRVLVRPGDTVPADGRVVAGRSSVDESLLTGEHLPVAKAPGDELTGGSVNRESPLQMGVERTGAETVVSQILRLLERAQAEKPVISRLADRAAAGFVTAVVALAIGVAVYWWHAAPELWLAITVSVLVVTCPCALSLATPVAITAAIGALTRAGLLVTRGDAVETLARTTRFVFDKTGTLTEGRLCLEGAQVLTELPEERCTAVARAIEQHSEHPIARAFTEAGSDAPKLAAEAVVNVPGEGLYARVADRLWVLGSAGLVTEQTGEEIPDPGGQSNRKGGTRVYLADENRVRCVFTLGDRLRPGALRLIAELAAQGIPVSILSGDQEGAVQEVARGLGIQDAAGGLRPAQKLARLQALQEAGEVVAMVGDGVNDAPVLAQAHVSIAMGGGAQVARASADMILLNEQLAVLAAGVRKARMALRVIRQNLLWAISYNLLALPAAALGYVAPWMAAIGMSVSSLLVVLNATRLSGPRSAPAVQAELR